MKVSAETFPEKTKSVNIVTDAQKESNAEQKSGNVVRRGDEFRILFPLLGNRLRRKKFLTKTVPNKILSPSSLPSHSPLSVIVGEHSGGVTRRSRRINDVDKKKRKGGSEVREFVLGMWLRCTRTP